MTRRTFAGAALGLAAAAISPAASREQEAQKVAEAWLTLFGQGKYGECWDQAAALFKSQIGREQWEGMAAKVGAQFGPNRSRSLKSAQFTHQAPGAPDGEYVVLQYAATFAKKANAIETVTPMKDPDGAWRVSGYFIR